MAHFWTGPKRTGAGFLVGLVIGFVIALNVSALHDGVDRSVFAGAWGLLGAAAGGFSRRLAH